ncbi:MAG TPA: hypothetical protein DCM86_16865 [Verrucomicrobiales bacterium]|nr:hypothetical protein [Verrucomicrobiales bacterium]
MAMDQVRIKQSRRVRRGWGLLVAALVAWATRGVGADKSALGLSAISLPKGPGSIEGLGESFQPSLNTGTASHRVPVRVPPGVGGFSPGLELRYDGGGANGPIGYGWSMGIPYVQRRTDHGMPTYGEDLGPSRVDTFINQSREELVPVEGGDFFCQNEGTFVRYRWTGDHWEGTRPDGVRMEFGLTARGRIFDAATPGHVFAWLLERETDRHGNVIQYAYRSYDSPNDRNQRYIDRITYGPGPGPWQSYQVILFGYETRSDWFEDARSGFLVRTGHRLTSITTATQGPVLEGHELADHDGDGLPDSLNRRYDLGYVAYAGADSHWSVLGSVQVTGADGLSRLPAAGFGYSLCNPPGVISAEGAVVAPENEPQVVMDNPLADLVDLDGDGLPDLLRTEQGGGAHTLTRNLGLVGEGANRRIVWSDPMEVPAEDGAAWNYGLSQDATHLADMDGDGIADLVHKSAAGDVFYFRNRPGLGWSARLPMSAEDTTPPAPFGDVGVRTADLDLDKRIDVIQSVGDGGLNDYRIWFNLGNQSYSRPVTVPQDFGFSLADSRVQLNDLNGDRVPDLARIEAAGIRVTAGLGYGRFAPPQFIPLPDGALDDTQMARARLVDINGDGLADLVVERAAPGELWYWLNLGTYALAPMRRITGMPLAVGPNAVTRWADLNGNGTVDLVYADRDASPRITSVDLGELLTCGGIPNLLTSISNGIGRVTLIGYASSVRYAREDEVDGHAWPYPLPFPVTVVAAVTNLDSLGHAYRSEFRYHDGYYDPVEKQFRGFARSEELQVGDAAAPTLVREATFDVGQAFAAMKGRQLRIVERGEGGGEFHREETAWILPPSLLSIGTNGVEVRFAHEVSKTSLITEQGQGTPVTTLTEMTVDRFGNTTELAEQGVVAAGDPLAGKDERIHRTTFAIDTNRWILRLPSREEILDGTRKVISRADYYYDDESFSAGNPGLVSAGNLTLKREWVNPATDGTTLDTLRARYDTYGNRLLALDGLGQVQGGVVNLSAGHAREFAYDPQLRLFVTRETIHVGGGAPALTALATFDCGLGVITSSTDFDGHTQKMRNDPFGRLAAVIHPGDDAAFPSEEFEYVMALPFGSSGLVNYIESRELDRTPGSAGPVHRDHYVLRREYFDGMGRPLMKREEAESASPGGAPRVLVRDAVLFNARMKIGTTLQPHFASAAAGATLDAQLGFESIEAPSWRGLFEEKGQYTPLGLAAAHSLRSELDALLRFVRVIQPDGSTLLTRYEPLVTVEFDENDSDPLSPAFGTPIRHRTDGLGRLVEVQELTRLGDTGEVGATPHAWVTSYEYDPNDEMTAWTDSQGNRREMAYDGLRRRTRLSDPERGVTQFDHDAASNLARRVDARQHEIHYSYDGANRLLTEDYLDDDAADFSYHRHPTVRFHYDGDRVDALDLGDGTRGTSRNTGGRPSWVEDPTGEEHFDYDDRGRIVATVKRVRHPGTGVMESYTTRHTLDPMGRLLRLGYPDGDAVDYRFNARALVSRLVGVVDSIDYTPSGQHRGVVFGNGLRSAWTFDARLRLDRWVVTPAGGGGDPWLDYRHTFDAASNLTAVEDLRPESVAPAGDLRRNSRRYGYDDLNRLRTVAYSHEAPGASFTAASGIEYRNDRIGNRLAVLTNGDPGGGIVPSRSQFGGSQGAWNRNGRAAGEDPGPEALTSVAPGAGGPGGVTWSYDENGNVRSNGTQRLTWDFRDRLVRVEGPLGTTEFGYDHAGVRVWKRHVPAAGAGVPDRVVILYPSRYFEVRDGEQPVKYVWNSEQRVARVVGSITQGSLRVQRLRLVPGWNLVAAAVGVGPGWETNPGADSIQGLVRWDASAQGWIPVAKGNPVPAGEVLWMHSSVPQTFAWQGTYQDPLPAGGGSPGPVFVAGPGLEALPLDWMQAASYTIWGWMPSGNSWWVKEAGGLPAATPIPTALPPGGVLFLQGEGSFALPLPPPADRIHYYTSDALESSTLITDAAGALVEEIALHPFGEVRQRTTRVAGAEPEPYLFVQKERDRETGFDQFGARYLASTSGRFLSVDPVGSGLEPPSPEAKALFWGHPQAQAAYAYGGNNPLRWVDRMGRDITTPLGNRTQNKQADGSVIVDVKGVKVQVMQDTKVNSLPDGKSANTGPDIKVSIRNGAVKVTLKLQTKYKDGTDPDSKSGYGRGTTDDDKKAGNTTLKFHEGQHGVDFLDWLEKNPPPVADGATVTKEEAGKLRDKIKEWKEKFKDYTETKTDCVGNKEPGCPSTPAASK